MLRNVKSHKYKDKTEFANDLDQIWTNCLTYNTTAVCSFVLVAPI